MSALLAHHFMFPAYSLLSLTIQIILFLTLAIPSSGNCAAVTDTIPPHYSWVSPVPNSVITTNSIRLAVDARDNPKGSGIEKVTFYFRYTDFIANITTKTFIGEVKKHPYEIIWDCSGIPDQNLSKLFFYCTVTDSAGNTSDADVLNQLYGPMIVLDRNPKLSNALLSSHRTGKGITLDGNLDEWASTKSVNFINNDNEITFYSMWNDTHLFFAARVQDNSIISDYTSKSEILDGMSFKDVIEIFLDTDHDHSEFCVLPDRHFLFSPAGKVYESIWPRDLKRLDVEKAFPNVSFAAGIKGTLNIETDKDAGYTIEASVSWKELGISPRRGRTIGLEVWNADRDFLQGTGSFAGWTTNAGNHKNPSEWGSLVLVEENLLLKHAFILTPVVFLLIIVSVSIFVKRKKPLPTTALEETFSLAEKKYIRMAKEYTFKNYSDEKLDREAVAAYVGLNTTYFGQVFKKETGIYYSDYLMDLRIGKAKELLRTTPKNVAEIAYETGFSSQSYFCTVFKKKVGLSPRQYLTQER